MQHAIRVEALGPQGQPMAQAVEKCVHCGFCLPTCPTYQVLGQEMDSPRGRIILMKSVLEKDLNLEEALPYIDHCLGCLACVTACPSGVAYNELLMPFRAQAEHRRDHSSVDKATRWLVLETLPYPERFRLAALAGRMAKPFRALLPDQFQAMLSLVPDSLPPAQPLPHFYPARGERRARVALLAGCVQQVLAPEIDWASLRVLAKNGVDILVPEGQGCCGALAMHRGDADRAIQLAKHNLHAFPADVDAIISNAAGCGSGMHEYPLLFKGTAFEEEASRFSDMVMDISEFLDSLGINPPPPLPEPVKLAYHDACHLAHAQGITLQPRQLLHSIPNLELVSISEAELCCGSAGTYNLEQPVTARLLGERKARNVLESGAQGVVTGNIGCMVQLRTSLASLGKPIPVWHTIEVLDRAYGNGLSP
jgi:glycolate oxidase iron-sulfur subunit